MATLSRLRPASSLPARVTRRLEALPLRLRLVAILMVLLLLALVLTASATAVLMRRDLIGRVDDDLQRAKVPVARQAASLIAACMLDDSATFLPAMSNAVP